jgi:transcriptional regulator with XRE-family HTH domain
MLMKLIGKKIRQFRHDKGWSQEDVAKRLNISIPAFSKIETGITDVNFTRLEQIAEVFGLTVIAFLQEDNTEQEAGLYHELDDMCKKLVERENEIMLLQRKVIALYEQINDARQNLQ